MGGRRWDLITLAPRRATPYSHNHETKGAGTYHAMRAQKARTGEGFMQPPTTSTTSPTATPLSTPFPLSHPPTHLIQQTRLRPVGNATLCPPRRAKITRRSKTDRDILE
ncbi:hypothetical protein NHX12_006741 [Muraenolepis orangiensis]|uniref:Uncharacterized protein n=1 Tax=Muraenolepis orangiensis TaxID=630683 RepID=A0A9Q0DNK6_9TELE|nr:hypothetical protein NHX12_006741 [Muraenolepis orangiensis]